MTATPRACETSERLLDILTSVADAFVHGFTREEKQQVLDLMDRMLANARDLTPTHKDTIRCQKKKN